MPRKPRDIKSGYCYHITTRCNNREFKLTRYECRQVFLYALKKAIEKFKFKLYGLCIMSNHVHYLLEPLQPEDLPKIMHWINWYTVKTHQPWRIEFAAIQTKPTSVGFKFLKSAQADFVCVQDEPRFLIAWYICFENNDYQRALNTLRYIHANPKAAGMKQGFFYDFSNYGTHDRLTADGITQWHPAFLALGKSLEECAAKYRGFCKRYKPKPKPPERRYHWGSKILPKVMKRQGNNKSSPGQMKLPWDDWEVAEEEVIKVAYKFVLANCYDPNTKF